MKAFMKGMLSRRQGYDGWALKAKDSKVPLRFTACTTREEARELAAELEVKDPDLFRRLEIVKVTVEVQELQK